MKIKRQLILLALLAAICLFQNGCATLGDAATGLAGLTSTLVKLPFDILGYAANLIGQLPMPPPGVFF